MSVGSDLLCVPHCRSKRVVFTPVRNVCSGAEVVRLGAVVPGEDP